MFSRNGEVIYAGQVAKGLCFVIPKYSMAKTENVSDFIHGPGPEWLKKSPYAICRYKSIKYIFKSHKVGQWMGKALLHEAIFRQLFEATNSIMPHDHLDSTRVVIKTMLYYYDPEWEHSKCEWFPYFEFFMNWLPENAV